MTLREPYARLLREALEQHRQLAEIACQANDLNAIREALNAGWTARRMALDILEEGERHTRQEALKEARAA